MKKKLVWLLSPILIIGLISCGGSTSDEAKELLLRLLKVVGIPQSIVVNICQDDNNNGFCESVELQTKVNINKGDDLNKILEKVSLTEEGEFFLENYDPSKKILMEIQDSINVNANQGNFTFTYNPTTQELSVLQMMIDEGYLLPDDVNAVRGIAKVDNFYTVLFRDFEANLNTLGDKALSSPRSVLANMKEMADELLANGVKDTLPQNINSCKDDQACIDGVLAPISKELLITDDEAVEIVNNETIENKKLVASKTFYSEGVDEQGNKKLYSNKFNSDSTSYTWEVIEGSNKGETGVNTITIEGNTLTDHTGNKVYLLLGKYTDLLLYEENNKKSRFYFDLDKLKSDVGDDSSELKGLIVGKTKYYKNSKGNVGSRVYGTDGTYAGISEGSPISGTYSIGGNILSIVRTSATPNMNMKLTYLNTVDDVLNFDISVNGGETFQTFSYPSKEARDEVTTTSNKPILGTWGLGDGSTKNNSTITFYNDGYYILAREKDQDHEGQAGMERGKYTWSQESGEFSVQIIEDTNGELGFNDITDPIIRISKDTLSLTVTESEERVTFSLIKINDVENSILGSWTSKHGNTYESTVITFYDNGYYIVAYAARQDNSRQAGIERGTYTWNQESGEFHSNNIIDTNGESGLGSKDSSSIGISNGKLLFSDEEGDTFSFNRVNKEGKHPSEMPSLTTLLAGKTVYLLDPEVVKLEFSSDLSSMTWLMLTGTESGHGGTDSPSINGMVLTIIPDLEVDPDVRVETITITKITEDYLVGTYKEEFTNNSIDIYTVRIYFDEAKARASNFDNSNH